MTSTAPSLVRRSKTDRIGTMLKQKSGTPPIIMAGEFQEPPLPMPEPTPIPGVGQFGTPGALPTSPGPADPYASYDPSGSQHFNPGQGVFGTLDRYMSPGWGTGNTSGNQSMGSVGVNPSGNLSAAGPFPGGNMGGPQGSVYGINPVTGNTIYNVTGSPRPGFFDSNVGKFVKGVGSTALNAFVPGLGFASGKVFDAIRRANERRNTGTDLSGRTSTGQNAPSGPAWYQPGYQPPQGIQDAIARGDYSRAYGPTANSLQSARIMASQAYGGNPNNARAFASEGRFLMDAEGAPRMRGPMYGDRRAEFRMPQGGPAPYASNQAAVSEWLMKQPAYVKFMQGRGG